MDNVEGHDQAVGRRIALGLADYIEDFASQRNAETWEEFAREDLLRWRYYLLEFADDPGTIIFFNLYGVDVRNALTRAATGRGSPTDWELLQIYEHDSWWPRIEWWNQEVRVSNPFDQGSEP